MQRWEYLEINASESPVKIVRIRGVEVALNNLQDLIKRTFPKAEVDRENEEKLSVKNVRNHELINFAGSHGWELVTADGGNWVFKRSTL
jgi:hypothetical protein